MSRRKTQNKTNIVLERISTYYHLDDDEALALFYGVSKSTISAWRTRNRVNEALIRAKCNDDNLANWFINGVKTYKLQNTDNDNLIREALTSYTSPSKISPSDPPPDIQDALKYAIMAFKILTSGTGYASALSENITWFDEAVDDKKRIRKLEDDMNALKEQLLASGTLSSK